MSGPRVSLAFKESNTSGKMNAYSRNARMALQKQFLKDPKKLKGSIYLYTLLYEIDLCRWVACTLSRR